MSYVAAGVVVLVCSLEMLLWLLALQDDWSHVMTMVAKQQEIELHVEATGTSFSAYSTNDVR